MEMTLDNLAELLRGLEAEMRTLRSEMAALREEMGRLETESHSIVRIVGDMIHASEMRLMDRITAFEVHLDTRIDRMR